MANRNPLSEVATLLGGAGGSNSSTGQVTQQLTSITQQLQQMQATNQAQVATLDANTKAVDQNTSAKATSGESTAGKVGSALENVFGLGLSPLISGLVSLFGGGSASAPAPLVPYVAPASVHVDAGISAASGGAFAVDTAAGGLPRPVPSASGAAAPTQIVVQVQALDSQSFMDHSDDIAQAVRQAMLTSTTLNDVIREV